MSKNLIISAAVGYKFSQIELFIKSIRRFYKGSVTYLIGFNDAELEKNLKKFDCEFIKVKIDKKEIQFKRYKIFLQYLSKKTLKIFFYVTAGYIFSGKSIWV